MCGVRWFQTNNYLSWPIVDYEVGHEASCPLFGLYLSNADFAREVVGAFLDIHVLTDIVPPFFRDTDLPTNWIKSYQDDLSLIHISEPTRPY